MAVGMLAVFAFLGLLVAVMHASSALLAAWARVRPEPPPPRPATAGASPSGDAEAALLIAIAEAARRGQRGRG